MEYVNEEEWRRKIKVKAQEKCRNIDILYIIVNRKIITMLITYFLKIFPGLTIVYQENLLQAIAIT